MLRRDVAPALIEQLLIELARTVAPLHPKLVYLAHPKPDEAWRAIAEQRGAEFVAGAVRRSAEWAFLSARGLSGLPGVLAYWQAHGALCDEVVSRLPMETLTVDTSEGSWPERRARICAFLDVGADEPAAPDPHVLERLTGRYRDGERAVTVSLDDGRLILRGALWPSNALLPVTRDVFDVEAWPFQIRFEEDGAGRVHALRWHGPRLWWGGPEGAYHRDPEGFGVLQLCGPMFKGDRMTPLSFTTTDGVRLAYAVDDFTDPWRDTPSVVLLHAAMSNLRRFYAWVPALARDLRVVRLDLRGHGDSETPGLTRRSASTVSDATSSSCSII
jgi:hypothetical protein